MDTEILSDADIISWLIIVFLGTVLILKLLDLVWKHCLTPPPPLPESLTTYELIERETDKICEKCGHTPIYQIYKAPVPLPKSRCLAEYCDCLLCKQCGYRTTSGMSRHNCFEDGSNDWSVRDACDYGGSD